MFRLFLRAFDYIYLINTKLVLYILFMFKRVLRFIFGLWTFLFVSLRGSKKKVRNNTTRHIQSIPLFRLAHSISIC